jgi:hypothetical protein
VALTTYVEMRDAECWKDVAGAFLLWCRQQKQVPTGGCHEGDPGSPSDARRYAAIAIPDHSLALVGLLKEWAAIEGRRVESKDPS